MGGQQFGEHTILIDTTKLNRVLDFDEEAGLIDVEAGILWPELITHTIEIQSRMTRLWGIAQKPAGVDRITLGGSLAANGHGRGLKMSPLIADIESFMMVDAFGEILTCSRNKNSELFRLVIGGYGLFGVVYAIKLRLAPWHKVERIAEVIRVEQLMPTFEQRIADGFLYGHFQFSTDKQSDNFLQEGIAVCYRPVDSLTPVRPDQKGLSVEDRQELLYLAHTNKAEAYCRYIDHYLETSGQIYESDVHQLSVYIDNYHRDLNKKLGLADRATDLISEICVPRETISKFMAEMRAELLEHEIDVIYGDIRLIEIDEESFLTWAKHPFACITLGFHTVHTPPGLQQAIANFRQLINMAIKYDGSYCLSHHKYATREQVEVCYPRFSKFLRLKLQYDPEERFQSSWYRHYRALFADVFEG